MTDDFGIRVAKLERTLATLNDRNLSAEQPLYTRGQTFTPSFSGDGTAGTFTYNAQYGFYSAIGNRVFANAYISITAISGSPTGNMLILCSGLPAVASVTGVYGVVNFGYIYDLVYPATALEITGIIPPGSNTISLYYSKTNAAAVAYPASSFTNANCGIIFSIMYQTS